MEDKSTRRIDAILGGLQSGDINHQQATDELFAMVYDELRRLASSMMQAERQDHTLQTTALVHEAYLRLARGSEPTWENRAHFFGIASRAMRQILVDHARRRLAAKREGNWQRITLGDELALSQATDIQIIDLDSALSRFAEQDVRMARVAELRIFGGLQVKEVAHILGVSRRTIHGDWRVAKMWLNRVLTTGGGG